MPETPIYCPYCNASVTLAPGTQPGQRVPCPRCGEAFPYRGPAIGNDDPAASSALTAPAPGDPAHWSNLKVAGTVLGFMALMAITGLAFALFTQKIRRAHDSGRSVTKPLPPVRTIAPANLPGLAYLPADTDVIAALHVAEALETPAGQAFLTQFHFAPADFLVENLTQGTGLALNDLDHAVLGLQIKNRLLPRFVLVVETRRPYDPDKLREALKTSKTVTRGKRTLYQFLLKRLGVEGYLWCAGEQTFLIGLTADDFDDVPMTPRNGSDHLAAPLKEMLQRMGPVAQFWLAGYADDWNKTVAKLPLASLAEKDRAVADKIRVVGLWLQFDQRINVNAALRCADEAGSKAVGDYLRKALDEAKWPKKLLGSGTEGEKAANDMGKELKLTVNENWVSLQAKADAK